MRTKVWDEKQQKWTYIDSDDSASAIDDGRSATDSTYSSKKIDELVGQRTTQADLNQAKDELKAEDENIRQSVSAKPDIDDTANNRETVLSSAESNERYANAFRKSRSGQIVYIDDTSPLPHTIKTRVESTNLMPEQPGEVFEKKSIVLNLPAGTYTVSVKNCTSTDVDYDECLIDLITIGGKEFPVAVKRGKPTVQTITASEEIERAFIFASRFSGPNKGDTAIFSEVQMEHGDKKTEFHEYVSALDNIYVIASGRNILNPIVFEQNGFYHQSDDTYIVKNSADIDGKIVVDNTAKVGGVYMMKYEVRYVPTQTDIYSFTYEYRGGYIEVLYTDGTVQKVEAPPDIKLSRGIYRTISAVSEKGKIVDKIRWKVVNPTTETLMYRFEISYTDKIVEGYEPYKASFYKANADGIVDDVIANYPYTTLLTGTPGVTIFATDNQDANKVLIPLMDRIAALEAKQTNI